VRASPHACLYDGRGRVRPTLGGSRSIPGVSEALLPRRVPESRCAAGRFTVEAEIALNAARASCYPRAVMTNDHPVRAPRTRAIRARSVKSGAFYACSRASPTATIEAHESSIQGVTVRLFRRKRPDWEEGERCPRCRERLPEYAADCMMCGLALAPLRAHARQAKREASGEARR
jgi:hypothetical protein